MVSGNQPIGLMFTVFTNGLGDWGSIPSRVIQLDDSLLNTQYCKVWIKDKVEQSREMSSTFPYTSV